MIMLYEIVKMKLRLDEDVLGLYLIPAVLLGILAYIITMA